MVVASAIVKITMSSSTISLNKCTTHNMSKSVVCLQLLWNKICRNIFSDNWASLKIVLHEKCRDKNLGRERRELEYTNTLNESSHLIRISKRELLTKVSGCCVSLWCQVVVSYGSLMSCPTHQHLCLLVTKSWWPSCLLGVKFTQTFTKMGPLTSLESPPPTSSQKGSLMQDKVWNAIK